ncbi:MULTISPECIES: OmpA family protein [unclassified Pseudomonas]|uniref:OmpA family protein n=1 Tax=unclassified Pseudomonas TaxID=196821 RepID=UPI000BC81144|nr:MULTISPECIES: OmpA family protein [unclassified Pseudomonas]PVZ20309.1 outer membrane protein OmpA-like peptidoglycan-associated protein [Pseudomonas sp. URIL14HWK12:I12]PVZ27375.1 outer membrane protein OmpA-like peptidoglycan-associated protein [Pseudomonas sp. URIL14HWK12:I10]PVZ38264.1 outer membrane protein OmpA-like peptidoglycan-associated protein [Pseudomonas sp. URIL14HWK12:I11]SNZ04048.1 Outer membrane protein OmpA [Pseudomonas sp. URIL14HWK12:I9]
MNRHWMIIVAALACAACARSGSAPEALQRATADVAALQGDADALRLAPLDVTRAEESLQRAERLAQYWGGDNDADHYAQLSLRYAQIARAHASAALADEQARRLDADRQRLQVALRESRLNSVQRQSQWVEQQLLALAAPGDDRGLVINLGEDLFDAGDAQLKPSANRVLLQLAQFLQLNPRRVVRVEGYTDSTGSAGDNLALSQSRAQAVVELLGSLGVAPERMTVRGYGGQFPLEANATERGRALNRRVEVVISDRKGALGPERE